MNRYDEIRARQAERSLRDVEQWHDVRCTYFVLEGAGDCDCMRADVDYLVRVVERMRKALQK